MVETDAHKGTGRKTEGGETVRTAQFYENDCQVQNNFNVNCSQGNYRAL